MRSEFEKILRENNVQSDVKDVLYSVYEILRYTADFIEKKEKIYAIEQRKAADQVINIYFEL